MDIVQISEEIRKKIDELKVQRHKLLEYGTRKASSIAEYEKAVAIIMIQLRNGRAFYLDGERIQDPPISCIDKIVKGLCFQEKIKMETNETLYKSLVISIEAIEAELNALQSLNRHLDLTLKSAGISPEA